ncbi:hypothetical protein, partial [Vibrio cidicii]|uniref:hypothetical protein n=1 Tax=Vibrio cidicii TaxID=1763883 RepID=UPI00370497CC
MARIEFLAARAVLARQTPGLPKRIQTHVFPDSLQQIDRLPLVGNHAHRIRIARQLQNHVQVDQVEVDLPAVKWNTFE